VAPPENISSTNGEPPQGRGFQSTITAMLSSGGETIRLIRNREPSALTSYSYAAQFARSGCAISLASKSGAGVPIVGGVSAENVAAISRPSADRKYNSRPSARHRG
jgi:hypothetical protein